MKTFTFINNERLCSIVQAAQKHIIYAAPSVSESVANALCKFAERDKNAVLRVILDPQAEVFRLGFGEEQGLSQLSDYDVDLRDARGLRIGILIADENAWIYAPTPEIIFEQPTADVNNAIQVSIEFAEQILLSVAPDVRLKTADEVLSQTIIAENLTPEIGTQQIKDEDFHKLKDELKENPPQKFDAARKVRVYQGYFQFVELSLTGCQLNRHTINIPKSLLNIAQDSDFERRVRSTCRLVDNTGDFSRKIKDIEKQLATVRKDFTKPLGKNFGVVILRKVRAEFEEEITKIRTALEKLSKEVEADLQIRPYAK